MEYLSGGSLVNRLRQGPLPLEETIEIVSRLAIALDTAHSAGLVHRDIKPNNVLFDEKGIAYLTDFNGIQLAYACLEKTPKTCFGPLGYMSPEQFIGKEDINHRSDIYSLGALFYQMLTGKPLFQSKSTLGYAIQRFDLSEINSKLSNLPVWFRNLLRKVLAQDPQQRCSTCAEFVEALRTGIEDGFKTLQEIGEFAENSRAGWNSINDDFSKRDKITDTDRRTIPPATSSAKNKRNPNWIWINAILILAILSGFVIYSKTDLGKYVSLGQLPKEHSEISGIIFDNPTATVRPTEELGLLASIPESPLLIENTTTPTGTVDSTSPSASTPTVIPSPTQEQPDQTITVNYVTQVAPTIQANIPLTYTIQYNDALFNIASTYGLDLTYLISLNNLSCDSRLYPGKQLQLPAPAIANFTSFYSEYSRWNNNKPEWLRILECVKDVRDLSFSPDGNILAVAQDNYIYFWRTSDWTPVRRLKGHLSKVVSIAFSDDGEILVSAGDDRYVRIWSVAEGTQLRYFRAHSGEIKNLVVSPDGKQLVTTSTDLSVKIWDTATGKLLNQLRGYKAYGAAFSSDGAFLAIGYGESVRVYQTEDYQNYFTMPSDEVVSELAFSSDGKLLASSSDIWHIGERKHIFHLQSSGDQVTFSNDNTQVIVGPRFWLTSNGSKVLELKAPYDITPHTQYAWESVALSPQGNLLAWGTQDGLTIWGIKSNEPPHQFTAPLSLYPVEPGDTYFNIAEKFNIDFGNLLSKNGLSCSSVIFEGQPLSTNLGNVSYEALIKRPTINPSNVQTLNTVGEPNSECVGANGPMAFSPDGRSFVSGGNLMATDSKFSPHSRR